MNWRQDVEKQSGGPFRDPPERQEIREATKRVREDAERKDAVRGLFASARRWALWLTAAIGLFIAVTNLPDAFDRLVKFFRGVH